MPNNPPITIAVVAAVTRFSMDQPVYLRTDDDKALRYEPYVIAEACD
jgi:hypothetical protein